MNEYNKAYEYIKNRMNFDCTTCVVLGSGYSDIESKLNIIDTIDYKDIPYFPTTTIKGHKGKLCVANVNGKNVAFMFGRFHYYEGYSPKDIIFYVRVLKMLGIENLILTNAAGAINKDFSVGDFIVISDHIKLGILNPLTGENDDFFGERFFDISNAYTQNLRECAKKSFLKNNVAYKEGVYAFMSGPCYETKAEVRALGILGADMVGMSTVFETIGAKHCAMKVLGISLITNMAAGILDSKLSHDEVINVGANSTSKFFDIISDVISGI